MCGSEGEAQGEGLLHLSERQQVGLCLVHVRGHEEVDVPGCESMQGVRRISRRASGAPDELCVCGGGGGEGCDGPTTQWTHFQAGQRRHTLYTSVSKASSRPSSCFACAARPSPDKARKVPCLVSKVSSSVTVFTCAL